MKRLFAIMAFLAGGISVELTKPLNCTLMESSQPRLKRHKIRCSNGK
ncbi:hypothetical protein EV677_1801 [Herminiimonas fonticola]|uniref:Uncharacterized protein n=1 Tax=Herminiimonas fonticola TaxID=303380 RepID=A0A4R6G700_9BURK|nr:hypothetical protein Hfont_1551 [Herminiimonas fonticola]TDN89740.1 hypothetical protein EV677_1801 [Herminiimonas fonticola]